MNNLITHALNSTELFIRANNLKPNIAHLTLFYYQFAYLKALSTNIKNQISITCSYYELNYHISYVVIMSYSKETNMHTLKRIKLNENVYKDLEELFDNDDEIVIDDNLVKRFLKIYKKYSKGEKYEQIFCKEHKR